MTDPESPIFFADYVLDMAVRELRHHGETVPLQPRVLDLLYFLVTNHERAVDKDAIQEAVWSGRIVSETALTRAIMKARRAIGDSAESQHLIRTVHGHGYQFVGQIRPAGKPSTPADDEPSRIAPTEKPAQAEQTHSRRRGLAIAALAVVAIAATVYSLKPTATPETGVRIAVLPVANTTDNDEYAWASLGLMGLTNDLLDSAAELDTVGAADVVRYAEVSDWQSGQDHDDVARHARELQRRYGASHILRSELTRNAGGLRLNYELFDQRGMVADGTMVSAQSTELIKGMVRSVTVALTKKRHVRDPELSIADDPFIDEAYARARSLSIEGRCADALPLYDVVLADAGDRARITLQRATCARILGRWQEAEQSFATLLDALGAPPDLSLRAAALAGLGIVLHRTGRLDEAALRYDAGLQDAVAAGDRVTEGRLLINRAILAKDQRRFDDAREDLARASVAYGDAGYVVLPGQLHSTLANIAMNDGKLDQAERHIRLAVDSFRQLGDRRSEALVLNNMGYLRREQGRHAEAMPFHQQSLAIRREIGDRVGQGRILGMISMLYLRDGQLETARDAAAEAVAIAREAKDALFIATGLSQLGDAQRKLGHFDDARASYEECVELFVTLGDMSRTAQAQILLAKLDQDQGDLDRADRNAEQIEREAARNEMHEPRIEALQLRGHLAQQRAQPEQAIGFYSQALELIASTGFAPALARELHVSLANLYLDAEDLPSAEAHLGTALDGPSDIRVARLQARYAAVRGNPLRAAQLLEAAKASSGNTWQPGDEQTLADYRKNADANR